MSKQKKQAKPDRPTLEEYSEYDDPRKRREIRSMYRDLINATQKNKEDLVKPQSTGLTEVLTHAETIFDNVRHTREAVLDSSLLLSVTNLGSEQARQLQTDFVTFDADEFADKLVEFMAPKRLQNLQQGNEEEDEETKRRKLDSLDWKKLGKECAKYFRRAPTVDFMLGPLVIEVPQGKVKKGRAKPEKMDASQKQAPEELSKVEEQEEATTKEVERIYGILRRITNDGATPVGFFEFITDPTSFGKTIENLFHLSFLVKDGKAGITIDEDGQPTVCKYNLCGLSCLSR
eukprot:Seg1658.10 transcript_id=Seg1658.10/GoldUCD/mRNA.D3Y31 product="Non-structural maintenance of chromosomes element 4 A" protein_id=Seg1658.10/GoldUCD/D3Y31